MNSEVATLVNEAIAQVLSTKKDKPQETPTIRWRFVGQAGHVHKSAYECVLLDDDKMLIPAYNVQGASLVRALDDSSIAEFEPNSSIAFVQFCEAYPGLLDFLKTRTLYWQASLRVIGVTNET